MKRNTFRTTAADAEYVERNGKTWLRFPIVPMREMVLNYPEYGRDEYLPAEKINATAQAWADTPLVARHPPKSQGQSARTPDAYTDLEYGRFYDPEPVDDGKKLRGFGHIDVEKANALGGIAQDVVDRLERGDPVEVSAGYGTSGDEQVDGEFDGDAYDVEQGTPLPDHIAVFPPGEFNARCDLDDGCGAPRLNAQTDEMDDDDTPDPSTIQRVVRFLGGDPDRVNHEGDEDGHDEEACDCGGSCDECSDTTDDAGDDDGGDADGGDADADDPPDDDGAGDQDGTTTTDADTDDDTTDMTDPDDIDDDRLAELHERTGLTVDTLDAMDDEELDSLDSATADAQDDDQTDTDADDAAPDDDTDGGNDVADDVDIDALVDQRVEEALENRETSQQVERDAEVVANATDIPKGAAKTMDADELADLADEVSGTATPDVHANYAGVPGQVDRANAVDADDSTPESSIGTGSLDNWEAESGGDN